MALGFRNLIRLPGKNFFNLSEEDAADMIDAYLAGGDAKFEEEALTEFRLVPNTTDWLEGLRKVVLHIDAEMRREDQLDGLASKEGRETLRQIARSLRMHRFNPAEYYSER